MKIYQILLALSHKFYKWRVSITLTKQSGLVVDNKKIRIELDHLWHIRRPNIAIPMTMELIEGAEEKCLINLLITQINHAIAKFEEEQCLDKGSL